MVSEYVELLSAVLSGARADVWVKYLDATVKLEPHSKMSVARVCFPRV